VREDNDRHLMFTRTYTFTLLTSKTFHSKESSSKNHSSVRGSDGQLIRVKTRRHHSHGLNPNRPIDLQSIDQAKQDLMTFVYGGVAFRPLFFGFHAYFLGHEYGHHAPLMVSCITRFEDRFN
jgi:hypothetical protein